MQPPVIPPPFPPKPGNRSFIDSLTLKIIWTALLTLILLIPVGMVRSLIKERSRTADEAVEEVRQKWSSAQTVTGPVLAIPYRHYSEKDNNSSNYIIRNLYILPETLQINGTVTTEELKRGLYDIVVYTAPFRLSGTFKLPASLFDNPESGHILLSEANLLIGISDLRGITEPVQGTWDQQPLTVDPGINTHLLLSGFSCPVEILPVNEKSADIPFTINLKMKGSESLLFIPLGKTTEADLASNCTTPSFTGAFLPEKREISDKGFKARWQVQYLNRNYPQIFVGEDPQGELEASAFGVNLLLPVDQYQKSVRSVKYAFLIIILTFVVCFFVEIMQKKNIHPLQYLLIGLALCLFYTLLVSISEHIGFTKAYLISALMTIGLLTAYLAGILKIPGTALTIGALLALLYTYIFMLIQMEVYALLAGSLGLFAILGVLMYYSLKIKQKTK